MQSVFFPWLSLKQPITIARLKFVPFKNQRGSVPAELADLAPSLERMLRGYVDERGYPVSNCVVVEHADRSPVWDLQDDDHELIARYTQIISLAAIAKNDYNTNVGCYANATTFQFFRQRF